MASGEASTSKAKPTSSSSSSTKSKYNTNCCVYGCHSRKGADRSIHFHAFPEKESGIQVKITNVLGQEEEIDKRKAWEKVLLMGKPVTKFMRVCSKHFKTEDYLAKGVKMKQPKLKRFAVPSQNLPKKRQYYPDSAEAGPSHFRQARFAKSQKTREAALGSAPLCESGSVQEPEPEPESDKLTEEFVPRCYDQLSEEEKVAVANLLSLHESGTNFSLDKEVQVSSGDIFVTFASTIKQDNHLNSLTGINSFDLLNSLTNLVEKNFPDKKCHKLSAKERIILVFMKLKMAIKLNVLSFLFKISPSWCKKVFVEYVGYLAHILKTVIHWPTYEECQKNMPLCFEQFRSVRIVLDCIEIPIEKPKCLCCRVRTYSHYKGRQTVKFMTGVSPAGVITFVSKAYGARNSDKAIFVQSDLIKKLCPRRDSIMVDKGFLIDQICNEHFIKLIRPSFLKKKKQFSETEAKENVLISKARVHIERVNQRIRIFNILNTPLSISFVPLIDDILLIICGLVNLQSTVLGDDKFFN